MGDYTGKTGRDELNNIFIFAKDGGAHFWCEEHQCYAKWNKKLGYFAVRGENNEFIRVPLKEDNQFPEGVVVKGGIPRWKDGSEYWGHYDSDGTLWGAMWWA